MGWPCTRTEVDRIRSEYDGLCIDAADEILGMFERGDGHVLYVEDVSGESFTPLFCGTVVWRYHAAAVIDGLVFDPWCPGEPLTVGEYLAAGFGSMRLVVTVDGHDIYSGRADRFGHLENYEIGGPE